MITYQDYEKAENKTKWLQNAIRTYRSSKEYKAAVMQEEYMAGRDVAILEFERIIYDMAGLPVLDFTKSNSKARCRTIHRLVTDRCSYSLGNGVSFASAEKKVAKDGSTRTVDKTKDLLGPRFDRELFKVAYWAQANGAAYEYVHKGHEKDVWEFNLFKKTEFLALYDEKTGALRGGVRFWSIEWGKRPITAILYTEEGYTRYETKPGKTGLVDLEQVEDTRPYVETVEISEAFGEEITGAANFSTLPIFPLYSGETRSSALDSQKDLIDAYDLVLSGFANDINDIPQVYWLVSGGYMSEQDKRQFLDQLMLQHMAVVNGEDAKIQGFTQEIPYEARERCLARLRSQMYENFGGFDVHTVEAGATNDHIEAGYWPMDEEADAFEYEIIDFIQNILAMMGIEDTPIFKRNKVSNQKEQTDMIMAAAQYLDEQTILEKLPWITVDEVDTILQRKDGESYARFDKMMAEQDTDEEDDLDEDDDDGGEDEAE